jgi:hypothetical protein
MYAASHQLEQRYSQRAHNNDKGAQQIPSHCHFRMELCGEREGKRRKSQRLQLPGKLDNKSIADIER